VAIGVAAVAVGLYELKTAAALLARIMPYYITATEAPPVATRSEIEAELKELGLPAGLIEYFQKAPVQLDPGEDPNIRSKDESIGAIQMPGPPLVVDEDIGFPIGREAEHRAPQPLCEIASRDVEQAVRAENDDAHCS
jgi:hypothetical protein